MISNSSFTQLQHNVKVVEKTPNVDYLWGAYSSIDAAISALGEDGEDQILAGRKFGVKNSDGSITEYWFTQDGDEDSYEECGSDSSAVATINDKISPVVECESTIVAYGETLPSSGVYYLCYTATTAEGGKTINLDSIATKNGSESTRTNTKCVIGKLYKVGSVYYAYDGTACHLVGTVSSSDVEISAENVSYSDEATYSAGTIGGAIADLVSGDVSVGLADKATVALFDENEDSIVETYAKKEDAVTTLDVTTLFTSAYGTYISGLSNVADNNVRLYATINSKIVDVMRGQSSNLNYMVYYHTLNSSNELQVVYKTFTITNGKIHLVAEGDQ